MTTEVTRAELAAADIAQRRRLLDVLADQLTAELRARAPRRFRQDVEAMVAHLRGRGFDLALFDDDGDEFLVFTPHVASKPTSGVILLFRSENVQVEWLASSAPAT